MNQSHLIELYDSLIQAAETSRQAGVFEVTFHALAAALHCAEALGDPDRLGSVERFGAEMHNQLARHDPDHRISSESAKRRGQTDVFTTLVVHAQSVATRIHASRVVDRARGHSKARDLVSPPVVRRPGKSGGVEEDHGKANYLSE